MLYGYGHYMDETYQMDIIPEVVPSDSDCMETVREESNGKQYFDYGEYESLFFYETEYFAVVRSSVEVRLRIDILDRCLDPIVIWNWWVERFLST